MNPSISIKFVRNVEGKINLEQKDFLKKYSLQKKELLSTVSNKAN